MPNNAVTDLVGVLVQHRILEPGQLDEVRTLQRRISDPRALFKELVQRGWLTTYQAGRILQGRGSELVLGPYLIMDLLGEGGAGQVYKARHSMMNRVAALKVLRKELVSDQEVVARFYREIEVASQISHPNIVHAYDAGPIGSALTLAMECVDGVNLDKLVRDSGPLPVGQACDYIRQAALGLQHAHERGLIHRDIKPSNLLVTNKSAVQGSTSYGTVKILDLGLARLQQPAKGSATKNLTVLSGNAIMQGTPDYMSPEQALDFHTADTRADIYSLGCTFFYLLTGQPPFSGATLAEKLLKHQTAPPPPLEDFRKDVPPPVAEIVRKMLAKRPPDRFQVPGEVAQALAPLVPPKKSGVKVGEGSGDKLPAVRKPAAGQPRPSKLDPAAKKALSSKRLASARRPRWLVLTGAAAALLFGILVFAVAMFGKSGNPTEASHAEATVARPATTRSETPRTTKELSTQVKPDRPIPKTSPGKDFDGTKDFVEVPHDAAMEPTMLTVEAWVNPASLPDKDDTRRWLVNKNVHEGTEGHYALIIHGKKVGAYVNIGGNIEVFSADLLQVNKWQHLAMSWDGFNLRVYYDGKEVALNPATVVEKPRKPGSTPLTIGRRQDGYDKSYFHGKLDDIRIYDHPLTEAEIRQHYLRPDATDASEKGMVFQRRF
jgi:serine/threonine-protein kinase